MKFKVKSVNASSFPHPIKVQRGVLPGLPISTGNYDGFGKVLSVSVEDGSEVFEEREQEDKTEE